MRKIIINGQEATFEDLKTLNRLYEQKKVKILFCKFGKNYINIITD